MKKTILIVVLMLVMEMAGIQAVSGQPAFQSITNPADLDGMNVTIGTWGGGQKSGTWEGTGWRWEMAFPSPSFPDATWWAGVGSQDARTFHAYSTTRQTGSSHMNVSYSFASVTLDGSSIGVAFDLSTLSFTPSPGSRSSGVRGIGTPLSDNVWWSFVLWDASTVGFGSATFSVQAYSVPEPSTLLLLIPWIVGLVGLRSGFRRRQPHNLA